MFDTKGSNKYFYKLFSLGNYFLNLRILGIIFLNEHFKHISVIFFKLYHSRNKQV